MPICLLHLPEDQSVRDTKKYQKARVNYENFDPHEEDLFLLMKYKQAVNCSGIYSSNDEHH